MDRDYYEKKAACTRIQIALAQEGFMKALPEAAEELAHAPNYEQAIMICDGIMNCLNAINDLRETLSYTLEQIDEEVKREASHDGNND